MDLKPLRQFLVGLFLGLLLGVMLAFVSSTSPIFDLVIRSDSPTAGTSPNLVQDKVASVRQEAHHSVHPGEPHPGHHYRHHTPRPLPGSDDHPGSPWNVEPMQHTKNQFFAPRAHTDSFGPFHYYVKTFQNEQSPVDFPDLPLLHSWLHYMEAYHNHFSRFRGKDKVVFMEVGVQSGGKIPMLRDYFGPGFEYIGIDINPSTRCFESAPWVKIEIGDSENTTFLDYLKQKYPHVDIFLDDGGHTMGQQKTLIQNMLPHVQPEGVYVVEDLSTSWGWWFKGIANRDGFDREFMEKTTWGLVHQTLDWFMSDWVTGYVTSPKKPEDSFFTHSWWKVIPDTVKHIHIYNQLVIYEKGATFPPRDIRTVGKSVPWVDAGELPKVNWDPIIKKIQQYTKSPWKW